MYLYEARVSYRKTATKIDPTQLTNSRYIYDKILRRRFDPSQEHFWVIFLTRALTTISIERVFSGTISQASISPRHIVQRALLINAEAIILAHNHPSGNAVSSDADRTTTAKIADACRLFDIRVLDHIVFGADGYCSFLDKGLL